LLTAELSGGKTSDFNQKIITLSAPMICYALIASQFLTFALACVEKQIVNKWCGLINKANNFNLPNLG